MENLGSTEPKVAVIIANWNGLDDTIECLESLKKISYQNYEVIVVDNGSRGNDVETLQCRFSDYIHLIKNDRNLGYAGGINVGISYVQGKYKPDFLLFLNNDTVVAVDFLTRMVESAMADNSIGIVGTGVYDLANAQKGIIVKIRMFETRISFIGINQINALRSNNLNREAVDGCCLLIRNDVIERIGYLDESYFCYWEDLDFYVRTKEAGYKIVCTPAAKIRHKASQTSKKISGLACYYYNRNKLRFMKKHATKWEYGWFITYYFLFYFELILVYYLIVKLNLQAALSYFRGVRDGFLNRDTAARLYGDNRFQG